MYYNKFLAVITGLSMIIAPAISYAGGFANVCVPHQQFVVKKQQIVHHNDFVIKQKSVEFDADYFLGYNEYGGGGYYDVVNELRAEEIAQDKDIILKQANQLDKTLELLSVAIEKIQQNNNKDDCPDDPKPDPMPEDPKPEPDPDPQPDPDPEPEDPTPAPGDDDLTDAVYSIFENNCASCHGPDQQSNGLQLIGQDENGKWLNDLSLDDRVLVHDVTLGVNLKERGKKLMPIGGPPLTNEEVETLRLWMVKKAEQIKSEYREKNNNE